MQPDDPRHGTYAGAQAHLRAGVAMCQPCRQSFLRYRRQRRYDAQLGRPRQVPTAPVIAHLERLRAQGVTVAAIAAQSGVSPSLVDELLNRPREVIRSDNADALLATVPPPSPRGYVPAVGTIRRIHALGRIGWSMRDIERESGVKIETLRRLSSAEPPAVTPVTARGIDAAYRRLSMSLPPAGRTASQVRVKATAKGWAPPLAWDDIDRDPEPRGVLRPTDRNSKPREFVDPVDPVVIERVLAGDVVPASRAEKAEIVRRWAESGRSLGELERLTGWNANRYYKKGEAA